MSQVHELGRMIKDIRRTLEMTGATFAKAIGTSQNYISRVENGGIRNPSLDFSMKVVNEIIRLVENDSTGKLDTFDFLSYNTPIANLINDHFKVVRHTIAPNDIILISDEVRQIIVEYLYTRRGIIADASDVLFNVKHDAMIIKAKLR